LILRFFGVSSRGFFFLFLYSYSTFIRGSRTARKFSGPFSQSSLFREGSPRGRGDLTGIEAPLRHGPLKRGRPGDCGGGSKRAVWGKGPGLVYCASRERGFWRGQAGRAASQESSSNSARKKRLRPSSSWGKKGVIWDTEKREGRPPEGVSMHHAPDIPGAKWRDGGAGEKRWLDGTAPS